MSSLKGPGEAQKHDASSLRIAIVHARWNTEIVSRLVSAAQNKLEALGVPSKNIETISVPGSWELPLTVQKIYAASQIQSAPTASLSADLLGSASSTDLTQSSTATTSGEQQPAGPFDAIIPIGVLIKGETMHFEYIAEAVSQGLMRVQLDAGVPVVFGVLTVLSEEQAIERAGGLDPSSGKKSAGEEWAVVAVELAVRRKGWAAGTIK
ncbi:MAG: hypothetical protein M1825_004758 [Sarcosagium campestre]|nr:MAG: hypothetical protein M1825_004758 [Sarcosagium campestre]